MWLYQFIQLQSSILHMQAYDAHGIPSEDRGFSSGRLNQMLCGQIADAKRHHPARHRRTTRWTLRRVTWERLPHSAAPAFAAISLGVYRGISPALRCVPQDLVAAG